MVNVKLQLFNYFENERYLLVAAGSPAIHYKVFAIKVVANIFRSCKQKRFSLLSGLLT